MKSEKLGPMRPEGNLRSFEKVVRDHAILDYQAEQVSQMPEDHPFRLKYIELLGLRAASEARAEEAALEEEEPRSKFNFNSRQAVKSLRQFIKTRRNPQQPGGHADELDYKTVEKLKFRCDVEMPIITDMCKNYTQGHELDEVNDQALLKLRESRKEYYKLDELRGREPRLFNEKSVFIDVKESINYTCYKTRMYRQPNSF